MLSLVYFFIDSNDSRQSLDSGRASPMQPFTNHYAKELFFYGEDDCKSTSVVASMKRSRSQAFDVPSSSRRCLNRSLHDSQDYFCLNQTREPCDNTNEEVIRSSPSKRHRFDVSNSSTRETRSAGFDFHHCSSCSGKRCVSIDHLNSSTHSDFVVNETKSRSCTSSNHLPISVDRFCVEERSITAFTSTGSYNNPFSTNEESYEPYFGLEVLDDDELSLLSFASAL